MATTVRPIRFDPALLSALEARALAAGEDVDRVVNAAVDHFLHDEVQAETPVLAVDEAARRLSAALMRGNAREARAAVDGALAGGAEVIDIHCDVLTPALHAVGHAWATDAITVAQEHRATEIATGLLASMAADKRLPATAGRLAIVSGSPDEQHVLGTRMVADLLERAGWEVIALGASTPAPDLVELARSECPDLVAVSTSTAGRLPGVHQAIAGLDAVDPRPVIVTGGPIYTPDTAAFAREVGADLATSDLRVLLDFVRRRFPPLPS